MTTRLIEQFLPDADHRIVHEIRIRAAPDAVLAAAESFDLESLGLVRALFRIRGWLLGAKPLPPHVPRGLVEQMASTGWGTLAVEPGRQRVMGAVTRPWEADVRFQALAPDAFATFAEPGQVKIVWSLEADPDPQRPGGTLFRTETRSCATDASSRRRFRRYWLLFSPGILLIRRVLLPAVRRAAEGEGVPERR
ncbi:MAG: hypothetical protein ACXWLF_03950 [Myxococcaceae bacterium]